MNNEKKNVSEKDEKTLRRFYGDEWEDHVDELMTAFAWYSDAYNQDRIERLHKLPAKERLYRTICGFDDEPKFEPDISRAEEIIRFPMELAQFDYEEMDMIVKFAKVLRGIIEDDGTVKSDYHLSREYVSTEEERDREMWVIRGKDREGETYSSLYPTLSRAVANFLIDCPFHLEEWLDYAALYGYDGVTGNDLRE